jgi:UDP-N-acetylmuramoylalanine--D-glutamate ligase
MIEAPEFTGKTVAVMGLGRSGLAAANALRCSGADVWAWDDDAEKRSLADDFTITDLAGADWRGVETLILSPGIPHTNPEPHPVAAGARAAGVDIISDVEILVRAQRRAGYVGVTGTNGKSTTTALISHILEENGVPVQAGGNFGIPALALDPIERPGFYILEMSSYQLDLTRSAEFDVAVLNNISADHLDRHGGMDGYIAAKKMIFQCQRAGTTAVVGVDDGPTAQIFQDLKADGHLKVIPVSGQQETAGGVYALNGVLYDDLDGLRRPILALAEIPTLPGTHNAQNAVAAYCAARAVGLAANEIVGAISSFQGLAHRQEIAAVIDGVCYVNDSKATNPDATARALACYDTIYWIAGGRGKEGGLEPIEPHLPHIRHAYLIGEAAERMASAFGKSLDADLSRDLVSAVSAAHAQASEDRAPGAVVLLSPACASFDQFADFEARGREFCRLVAALPGARRHSLNSGEAG